MQKKATRTCKKQLLFKKNKQIKKKKAIDQENSNRINLKENDDDHMPVKRFAIVF